MSDALLTWRKSTHSGAGGSCVEVAGLPNGSVLVRNSNHPDAGTLMFTSTEMEAWIAGFRAGEFDDFAA